MSRPAAIAALCALAWGCTGEIAAPARGPIAGPPGGPRDDAPIVPPEPPPVFPTPLCHDVPTGQTWLGLDGQPLETSRLNVDVGADRARIEPFPVVKLSIEHRIGVVALDLWTADVIATLGGVDTSGAAPGEWFREPESGPMTLFTVYRIGFAGCHRLLSAPPYWVPDPEALKLAPTVEGATSRCRGWMSQMWGRTPTEDQVQTCVTLLTVDLAGETDALSRWSNGCAAVFTSAQEMAD